MDGKDVKEIIIGIKTKVIWLSNDLEYVDPWFFCLNF